MDLTNYVAIVGLPGSVWSPLNSWLVPLLGKVIGASGRDNSPAFVECAERVLFRGTNVWSESIIVLVGILTSLTGRSTYAIGFRFGDALS